MALTKISSALTSYSINTWTDFVAGAANGKTLKGITICNPTVNDILLSMRVATNGGAAKFKIIEAIQIGNGESYTLDIDVLNIMSSDKIQIYADTVGLEFYASGVQY